MFFEASVTRQGQAFFDRNAENREGPLRMLDRPGILILFIESNDIVVRDITILDAPNWCLHLACCKYALLTGLNVRNSLRVPNADAIDVGASQNVRISDSYLEAGDDGIAVSPCGDGYCRMTAENITVSNCVIVSRSAGIRLGWAGNDIRNLTFENLIIRDSNRGIGIFVRGTENIENVLFSNIVIQTRLVDGLWWGLGEPVHISVIDRDSPGPLGKVRNVSFVNVTSTSESPVVLYSSEPGKIRDIVFRDYRQGIRASALNGFYGGNLDLRPTTPEKRGIRKYDLAGLKAHNVENLDLRGFDLEWLGAPPEFFTSGIEFSGFKDLRIEGFRGRGPAAGMPAIRVEDGEGLTVQNSRAVSGKLLESRGVTGRTLLSSNEEAQ
jgi:hypothetical protein